jgi:acyl-CoA dehydrogenase
MTVTEATTTTADYRAIGRRIALDVAAVHAAGVDRDARFPSESFAALRAERLLGAMVPVELGGRGASMTDMAAVVEELGQQCASTGMVFAMHQIQVASLVRHGRNDHLRTLLADIAGDQLLCASATTEVGIGGDVRSSLCAVETDGDRITLVKQAPVISYGDEAEVLLVTARRTPDSPAGDQVLTVFRKDEVELEPTGTWDTLGFRGTVSPGFVIRASGPAACVLDDLYTDISARTMLPAAHILWSHLWLGMATYAVDTARRFVRSAARSKPGTTPPGAVRLAELAAVHQQMVELVHGGLRRYEDAKDDPEVQTGLGFAIALNSLKVSASTMLIDIVGRAIVVTGIAAYREDSPYSLGRLLRDSWGAPIMVNNDRILGNTAQLLLVSKG